jgi:lipopolysaccharide/colanic/teichoic acid biosynthesis glycosyltransferase
MLRSADEGPDALTRPPIQRRIYLRVGKRAMDVSLAGVGLILLSPIMAVVALLVGVRDGWPVLYVQVRPGRYEQPFRLFKFRTMAEAPPAPDHLRLTRVGVFLRRWSLDELPQLVNVLRGLVGPRPLLSQYLPHFTPTERKRFVVRPGLTGWAQVHGRNAVDWDTRLALDAWYVDECSFLLDLRIMAMTIGRVVSGHGVNVDLATGLPDFDRARAGVGDRPPDPQDAIRARD